MRARRPVDEQNVVEAWERQCFDSAALGRLGLRVMFRGVPSDAGGPDYQDVLLVRQGETLVSGDVEFHVRSSDWYGHRHHLDPRYDRVILHVVWIDDALATSTSSGREVPVLEVGGSVPIGEGSAPLGPHACTSALSRLPPDDLHQRVREAGMARFYSLAERFAADLTSCDPDQIVYAALLESLGYASNRSAFRALAEAVPFHWLISIPAEQRSRTLLDAAGLGVPSEASLPARLSPDVWRLARLRPANHPARRLRGIAGVITRLGDRPADALAEAVLSDLPASRLRSVLRSAGDLGPGRADEMMVSVVLPFVHAYTQRQEVAETYSRYRSPPPTRWTRRMQAFAQEAGHDLGVRTAPEHQGLHALYLGYCRFEGKAGCPICGT
jgi:hypothetical protein